MALDYVATSKQLVDAVGGAGNIASATHCMTRLRLVLKDVSKANDDKVKSVKGVKSVIKQGGQYQIVIGNEVSNLFKEFKKLGNFAEDGAAPAKAEGNPVQRLFGFIAGCLTPLLPAMLGTGMVKVLLTLLTTVGWLSSTSPTYTILYSMADSFFYFLPIMLGWSIAKKTGHSVPLYMVIGAALVYPDLITLLGGTVEIVTYGTFLGQSCTYLFGFLPVIGASYTSSVLPMLLMAPFMGWIEDFADRVSPTVLKAFLKPMIFLLLCTPLVLVVFGPLGSVIGNVLASVMSWLYDKIPWLTVGVLSALMPFIVMTGMHYALIPLMFNNMATLGYDVIVLVTMFCSNICQGGSSFGVAFKTKDTEIRSEGIACGISAIVAGVTEPAMYGINMRFVKPMIGAVVGAGTAGLLAGITGVKGYSMGGSPSILSLIQFVGGEGNPMRGVIWGAICAAVGIGLAFIISFILYRDEKEPAPAAVAPIGMDGEAVEAAGAAKTITGGKIASPVTGKVIPLSEIKDEVFSSGALGQGVGIIPSVGEVYAPADGELTTFFPTGHAIGIATDNGAEILIHVGMDTVSLNGKGFKPMKKQGDRVKKGELLLKFDINVIQDAGLLTDTPVVVTNVDDFGGVETLVTGDVKHGQDIIELL